MENKMKDAKEIVIERTVENLTKKLNNICTDMKILTLLGTKCSIQDTAMVCRVSESKVISVIKKYKIPGYNIRFKEVSVNEGTSD